jgi:acetyl-CoA carboxylase carboxyltransferase component
LRELTSRIAEEEHVLRAGGGPSGHERQRKLGRLTVRERLDVLLDPGRPFLELGLWAAHGMYDEWGAVPAAGVVTGIGWILGRPCLLAANDATVKAGAMFPQSVKKLLRAQRIAYQLRLPVVYLVDSAGVFLPLQDEIFPDEDDFGRIFRNNAVLSAAGIPQYAAVMGHCVAGGAYLPVLCDTMLMVDGSELYLAGPALVKAAIGQDVDPEQLGGAKMHAAISGTTDFRDPDDRACLARLRSLIDLLPRHQPEASARERIAEESAVRSQESGAGGSRIEDRGSTTARHSSSIPDPSSLISHPSSPPARDPHHLYDIVPGDGASEYDVHGVLACIVDQDSLQEYKAEFGRTLVTAYARIGGHPVGVVANQRQRCKTSAGELQIGGVLYPDSVDKAARFVMDCNQTGLPLVFLQDVQGFMVGKAAEQSGIIRAGAKLVNVVSNSVVPKFTVVIGGSFGAGNYALCGKAYDPALILAWPSARYAVMGAHQAADTLLSLRARDARRAGQTLSDDDLQSLRDTIRERYEEQTDIRYGAARGWVDAIIPPHETRLWLETALQLVLQTVERPPFRTGVLQV